MNPDNTPRWRFCIPSSLQAHLDHYPHLRKALANTGWLFADKIIRLGVGFLVWTWLARYLGPELFGLLNYAGSFVAIFSVMASLGLNGIVVRNLVRKPNSADTTLGTAFVLQVLGGIMAFVLALITISIIRPNDDTAKSIVVVLGLVMILKATEVVKFWFESNVQSKHTVCLENSVFLMFATIKALLILTGANLMAFVWATFAEGLVVAAGLLWVYGWRGGRLQAWRSRYECAKILLKDSWPLILSGLAVMVYMRIDQIMLGHMLGDQAVGIYSSAVRLSEVWYFIPMAITSSIFPSIIAAKKNTTRDYYRYLQRLYDMMVLIAVAIALPVSLWSHWITLYLFGDGYTAAGPVLTIHVWSSVFVFLGVASGNWFLLENMQVQAFYRTALGALVNVLANFVLIPMLGIIGAAVGTLIAQIFAAYLFDWFGRDTRRSFWLKTASLLPFIPAIRARGSSH